MANHYHIPTDLTGQVFGRWTVIKFDNENHRKDQHRRWICRCSCGTVRSVSATRLTRGVTQSCGCGQRDYMRAAFTTHGLSKTAEYRSWKGMIQRCENANLKHYERYGGRGISVCKKWRNSFTAFLADVGPRPGPGYSLERKNNDLGYQPNNTIWADWKTQQRNKRSNHYLTFRGITKTLAGWAEVLKTRSSALWYRLRQGWSVEETLTIPVSQRLALVTFRGETKSLTEWSRVTGIKLRTLYSRIFDRGWPIERALTEPIHPNPFLSNRKSPKP